MNRVRITTTSAPAAAAAVAVVPAYTLTPADPPREPPPPDFSPDDDDDDGLPLRSYPATGLAGPQLVFEEGGLVVPLLRRGTYWIPVLTPGTRRPVCVNVSSAGDYTARVLLPGEDWAAVEATMRERLEADDPLPPPMVRGGPTTPGKPAAETPTVPVAPVERAD